MPHGLSLAGAILALASAGSACSGGAKADGATIIGRVQDEAGTGIEDAVVLLDGDSTNTGATGGFTFAAKKGTSVLDVTAAGYRRVNVELRIANGDNVVDITMVVCTPVIDAGCDVPTPTPTPTATPPNVFAAYDGANANLGGGQVFAWNGKADLAGTLNSWTLGDEAESAVEIMGGSDVALNECWADDAETTTFNGGALDHCVFWFDGEAEGGVTSGNPDAIFYVRIPGAKYVANTTVTFADGMTAGYYEGDFTATSGSFSIGDYTLQRSAVSGTLQLGAAGTTANTPVNIVGQASFYIPNLP